MGVSNPNDGFVATVRVFHQEEELEVVKIRLSIGHTASSRPGPFGVQHRKIAYSIQSNSPIVAYQFNPLDNVNVFSNDASLFAHERPGDRLSCDDAAPPNRSQWLSGSGGVYSRKTKVFVEPTANVAQGGAWYSCWWKSGVHAG